MVGAAAAGGPIAQGTIFWKWPASDTVCEVCGGPLRRQRSSTRYPLGVMLGEPRVRYVEKKCVRCGKVYRPETYHQLVPPQGNYAFDLIVAVGLARFRQHRQNGEIQAELHSPLRTLRCPPPRSTSWPTPSWTALAATHQARAPQLRKRLEEDGGYVLHVDGTCEPGTDTVFNAVAGNRGWTLAGAKMSGEDVKQIAGLLRRCVESFGTPLALVRDLSPQIEAAGKEALPGVLDLICHYHFLENVGRQTVREAARETHGGTASLEDSTRPAFSAKGPGPLQ